MEQYVWLFPVLFMFHEADMLLGIILGIIFAIAVVIGLVSVWPMCFMRPLPSGTIEGTDIIAIRNRINNLYFIPSGEKWIVIDAGSDARAIVQEMGRMSIDGRKVKSVFLTHTDYDHVAAVCLFPNATIHMSKQEKQMIDGSTYRQLLKKNKLPGLRESGITSIHSSNQRVPGKLVWMTDNETIDLEEHKVRMIWVPGHTRGSAMYAVDEKYLFTGDAFRPVKGNIRVHPYTMDRRQAKRSIQKIRNEMGRYEKVFTAHYGYL